MKTSRLVLVAVAVLALLAVPARAQEQAAVPHGGLLKCLSILDLTDQQKADIKHVLETEKPVVAGLLQALKTDGQALKAALEQNPPDPCAIGGGVLKVKADREALRAERQKIAAAVGALLTDQQKAKLEGCLQAPRAAAAADASADEGGDF